MIEKTYLTAEGLLQDAFSLAAQVWKSGFEPSFIIGIWRGGAPIGIAVQEMLDYFGLETDPIAIRTSSYSGVNERSDTVRIHGLGYLIDNINAEDRLLIPCM